eukprot:UN32355
MVYPYRIEITYLYGDSMTFWDMVRTVYIWEVERVNIPTSITISGEKENKKLNGTYTLGDTLSDHHPYWMKPGKYSFETI